MSGKKIFKISILINVIGLAILLMLFFFNVSYPNPIFKIFLPIGLLVVFVGLILGFIGWIMMMKDAVVSKQYKTASGLFFWGALLIILEVCKILMKN